MQDCLVCQRIEAIQKGTNKHFICELETSYVVLGDSQYYKGYTLLLSKTHCTELHQLDVQTRNTFLQEMAHVAQAIHQIFKPVKLNYELLGNKYPHLHWHLFPRYADDPNPTKPIWVNTDEKRNQTFLSDEEREAMIQQLREEILSLVQTS